MRISIGEGIYIQTAIFLAIVFLIWNYYRKLSVPIMDKYQTFWPRFWTGTMDSFVLTPLFFLISEAHYATSPFAIFVIIRLLGSFGETFYGIVMTAKYGQTIGRMVCKIKIVDHQTENPIGWGQAFLRFSPLLFFIILIFGYGLYELWKGDLTQEQYIKGTYLGSDTQMITYVMGGWFFIELLTMLANEKRRAIHDYLAGTVVIRTNIKGSQPLSSS